MPSYMLDTNVLIHLRRRRSPALTAKILALPVGEAVMSVVTYGELCSGAEKSINRDLMFARLHAMMEIVAVLDLPTEAGLTYGQIRSDLERRGQVIGPNDLWIAAHAQAADLTLVTSNQREFRRVPGLKIADWT